MAPVGQGFLPGSQIALGSPGLFNSRLMYYVYVLKSQVDGSLYKGYTKNLQNRIKEHNQGKSTYTASRKPWEIVYVEEYSTSTEAIKRERYLKSSAGRRFLKKIL
jgi:putative endonuclease